MAEKKVSGRRKKTNSEKDSGTAESRQEEKIYNTDLYGDFQAAAESYLRKRTTRTVWEPKKKPENTARTKESTEEARCGEIDPHTTINPAIQRQILTKRSGRILSDDTGFKAQSYNTRFELRPEMPEISRDENGENGEAYFDNSIPGQQTMADLVAGKGEEEISVPVEGQISDPREDLFDSVYNSIKDELPKNIGKSEKLRAIARTAADDADMEPDSQLVFPAFDPLFKFPEKEEKKTRGIRNKKEEKSKRHKHKPEKHKNAESKEKSEKDEPDFDETFFVTSEAEAVNKNTDASADNDAGEDTVASAKAERRKREKRLIDFLDKNLQPREKQPSFELESKNDIKSVWGKISRIKKLALIKASALTLLSVIVFIGTAVFENGGDTGASFSPLKYLFFCLVFLVFAGAICVKELKDGLKDIRKLRFTSSSGALIIFFGGLVQILLSFFAGSQIASGIHILTPAAIFFMNTGVLPKIFLSDNSMLALNLLASSDSLSVLRKASDGGIDGAVKDAYGENGAVRYFSKTEFLTGIIKKLYDAVPEPFGEKTAYISVVLLSLTAGAGAGFLRHSLAAGAAAFSGMLISAVPVTYALSASVFLASANKKLGEKKASLLSFKASRELENTGAVILNGSELIEKSSCCIHGIKPFGHFDPKKAVLYAASVMNASDSPLTEIINQVISQGDDEIPSCGEFEISEGKGVAAYVESSQVLLGTEEFLRENNVYVPDTDFKEKYITGDRKLLFLSVNGELSMIFTVSYHIKRSVSALLKYLAAENKKIVIYSCDPNVDEEYISKKCRLTSDKIAQLGTAEASYFRDKDAKTDSALPADVFTNGSLSSLFMLLRRSRSLNRIINNLPAVIYVLSAVSALLVAVPAVSGDISVIGSAYIFVIKVMCFALEFVFSYLLLRKK